MMRCDLTEAQAAVRAILATIRSQTEPTEATWRALIQDELFDPSTSPDASKSAEYFEAWQDGYDASLTRVLSRAMEQASLTEVVKRGHQSDCAVHNEPEAPAGPCDCGGIDLPDDEQKSVVHRDELPGQMGDFLRSLKDDK